MVLKMNYNTFRDELRIGLRWPWEDAQSLQLCMMDGYARSLIAQLITNINSMVSEFALPLQVKIAGSRTRRVTQRLLAECSVGGTIYCWRFLEALNRERKGVTSLRTGLVIAFDGNKRRLRDASPYKPNEPAEWGWTQDDGLILLRLIDGQPLRNLVRHEMGHLLGIGQHHPDCVMSWGCPREEFCAECKQTISETCHIKD